MHLTISRRSALVAAPALALIIGAGIGWAAIPSSHDGTICHATQLVRMQMAYTE